MFLRYFNSKNIKIVTMLMTFLSIVIVLVVNVHTLLQTTTLEETRLLYLRDWVFFREEGGIIGSVLYYVAFIIAMAGGLLFFKVRSDLKEVERAKSGPQQMRQLLITTTSFMGVGLIIEALYLIFKSDFVGTYEVVFQLYIFYHTFVMVMFIVITLNIFMEKDLIKSQKKSLILIGFLIVVIFVGYFIMILYGLDPLGYSILIVVPVVLVVLVAIVSLVVAVRILSLRNKVKDEEIALSSISFIVLLVVLSIVFLIVCGLTINTDITVNRIFRILRVTTLLVTALLYYPAFIRPAKKNVETPNDQ